MQARDPVEWVPKKPLNKELVDKYLSESIESNHFTNGGPNVTNLENFIMEKFDICDSTKKVICVCNGSSAIQVLCAAIQYVEGDFKWATQSFTFPPSAQSILKGSDIVDIDEEGGLDLSKLTESAKGIIVTNIFGNVVDIRKYEAYAESSGKFLVFDNAATPYTTYEGKNACNYGHGCVISFHHTKPLGFGEGGAIVVDRKYEVAVRRLINFGLDNLHPEVKWHPDASNHKMSDVAAVYILQYLDSMGDIIAIHKKLYSYMKRKLQHITDIRFYPSFGDETPFVSCFSLLFESYNDEIREKLIKNGVFCRKYYKPLVETPTAVEFYKKILCVPCNRDMTYGDIDLICSIITA